MPDFERLATLPLFDNSLLAWSIAGAIALGVFFVLLIVRRAVRSYLRKARTTPQTEFLEIPVQVLSRTTAAFFFVLAIYLGIQALTIAPGTQRILQSAITIALFWQAGLWAVEGVAAWLDEVLGGTLPVASRTLMIDYERYARAEAALGWLNARVLVNLEQPLSPAVLAGPLVDGLEETLTTAGARIAHLKIFDGASTGSVKIAVCRNGEEPDVEGDLAASPASRHDLVLNLRAEAGPELLREVVEAAFARLPPKIEIVSLQAFQPLPPKPQHRMVNS